MCMLHDQVGYVYSCLPQRPRGHLTENIDKSRTPRFRIVQIVCVHSLFVLKRAKRIRKLRGIATNATKIHHRARLLRGVHVSARKRSICGENIVIE